MTRRLEAWVVLSAAVVLATRAIVYALAPQSVLLDALAHDEGGPKLAGVLTTGVVLAGGAALAVLWITAVAVRERLFLEGRRIVDPPRLQLPRLAARAVAFFLVTSFAFAMIESYIHWREGLGWHGLHCLVGPVHRDAIPVLAALSLVAVAAHGAVEHLLAWARRLVSSLAASLPVILGPSGATLYSGNHRPRFAGWQEPARGPPAVFVSVPSS